MSKIRLHGSSSGYTEIAPVAASGNNTLTLPNDGTIISQDSNGAVGVTSITVGTGVTIGDGKITCDGSALTSINAAQLVGVCTSGLTKTGGFGKILQVKHAFKKDAFSDTSGNFAAITGLSVTIAAASTSNKLLFQCSLVYSLGSTEVFVARLYDGTSEITATRPEIGSTENYNGWICDYNKSNVSSGDIMTNVSKSYLHTPTDTNSHTYNIYVRSHSGATVYINRRGYGTDFGGASSFSVMEVEA